MTSGPRRRRLLLWSAAAVVAAFLVLGAILVGVMLIAPNGLGITIGDHIRRVHDRAIGWVRAR